MSATLYWRRVLCSDVETLLDASRVTRDLYLYLAAGPMAERTGLIVARKSMLTSELSMQGRELDLALAEMADLGVIAFSDLGRKVVVVLLNHAREFQPRDNTRSGWLADVGRITPCSAVDAWFAVLTFGPDDVVLTGVAGRNMPKRLALEHDPSLTGQRPLNDREEKEKRRAGEEPPPAPSVHAPQGGLPLGDQPASKPRPTRGPSPDDVIAAYIREAHHQWVIPRLTDGKAPPSLRKAVAEGTRREPLRDWSATFREMALSGFLAGKRPPVTVTWCIGPRNLARWDAGEFRGDQIDYNNGPRIDRTPSPYRMVSDD